MLFHSLEFIFVFLPVTWIGFFLLIRSDRFKLACGWLTLASLAFYSWWNPIYVVLICGSILLNFVLGRLLCTERMTLSGPVRKRILYSGLTANLAALVYFKYANFFLGNINSIFGSSFNFQKVILPLAISFFTFQQIVYITDAYRGGNRKYSFAEYAFFVLFFPHLIAGPIVHHHELLPQVAREKWQPVRLENLQVGLTIFVIGLFKKMVLADGCGAYATPLFSTVLHGGSLSTGNAWLAAISYSLQLYFDFSGYSDMAIGIARLFGILLPVNFYSPYRATSMIEFWRRWHITLSRFLREYIYIPLGGNRKGPLLRYSNLLITMMLGGLWHGAGWTFVAWGAIHGACLVINHLFRDATRGFFEHRPLAEKWFRPFAWLLTMTAVVISWVFFRAANFQSAKSILASMFSISHTKPTALDLETKMLLTGNYDMYWLLLLGLIALIAPSTQLYLRNYTPTLDLKPESNRFFHPAWKPTAAHAIFVGILIALTMRQYFALTPTEFIYFNF